MLKNKHIHFLQDLIKCKSITPANDGAIEAINNYLENLNFSSIIKSFDEGGSKVLNIYSTITKNSHLPNLCFLGHVDVVPPGEGWSYDPFSATITDGILYGRGAVDMKGAIIAFIAAVEQYLNQNKSFGTISLLLTGDEEAVAKNGTDPMSKYLFEEENIRINHSIVGEPGSIKTVGDAMRIGARGSATFLVTIYGEQGHVAYGPDIDNPVKKANAIIAELSNYPFIHVNKIFKKANAEVTKIVCDSGAENMIPNKLVFQFNIRYGDDYNHESLKEVVQKIILKHCEKNQYEVESWSSGNAFIGVKETTNNEFINIVKDVLEKENSAVQISAADFISDARFMKRYCDVIEVGLVGKTAHKINEHVSINDLEKLTKIYFNILNSYFEKFSA